MLDYQEINFHQQVLNNKLITFTISIFYYLRPLILHRQEIKKQQSLFHLLVTSPLPLTINHFFKLKQGTKKVFKFHMKVSALPYQGLPNYKKNFPIVVAFWNYVRYTAFIDLLESTTKISFINNFEKSTCPNRLDLPKSQKQPLQFLLALRNSNHN